MDEERHITPPSTRKIDPIFVFGENFRGIFKIPLGEPGVLMVCITFPLKQKLEMSASFAVFENCFDLVFVVAILELKWR